MGRKRRQRKGTASMSMTYSPAADALAIELLPDHASVQTMAPSDDVRFDFDADGRLIGVEVLNASRHYPPDALARVGVPRALLTLREASEESGLDASTLRHQIRNGRLVATKRGHDWFIDRAALWNYLEGREAAGRPPARDDMPAAEGR